MRASGVPGWKESERPMPLAMGRARPEAWAGSGVTPPLCCGASLGSHVGSCALSLLFSSGIWTIADFLVFSTLLFKGARQIFVVV